MGKKSPHLVQKERELRDFLSITDRRRNLFVSDTLLSELAAGHLYDGGARATAIQSTLKDLLQIIKVNPAFANVFTGNSFAVTGWVHLLSL